MSLINFKWLDSRSWYESIIICKFFSLTGFFNEFILKKELIDDNEDKYIFLLEFLLAACSFLKGWIIVRVSENKLNKESKLELSSPTELSLLKSFQLLEVEEGWLFKLF